MTIYRADMLSAQQNFILRRNLQVSFEQEKERFGCKERKLFVNTEMLVFIIEIIGTVAFASSGAMVGIRKKMDVLGVIVMAGAELSGIWCWAFTRRIPSKTRFM